jgi:hypothetical protein
MMAENFLHPSIVPQSMSAATPTPDADVLHRGTFRLPLKRYIELLEGAPGELAVKRCLGNRPQRPPVGTSGCFRSPSSRPLERALLRFR